MCVYLLKWEFTVHAVSSRLLFSLLKTNSWKGRTTAETFKSLSHFGADFRNSCHYSLTVCQQKHHQSLYSMNTICWTFSYLPKCSSSSVLISLSTAGWERSAGGANILSDSYRAVSVLSFFFSCSSCPSLVDQECCGSDSVPAAVIFPVALLFPHSHWIWSLMWASDEWATFNKADVAAEKNEEIRLKRSSCWRLQGRLASIQHTSGRRSAGTLQFLLHPWWKKDIWSPWMFFLEFPVAPCSFTTDTQAAPRSKERRQTHQCKTHPKHWPVCCVHHEPTIYKCTTFTPQPTISLIWCSMSTWAPVPDATRGLASLSHSQPFLRWRRTAAAGFPSVLPLLPMSLCTLRRLFDKTAQDWHENLSVCAVVAHSPAVCQLGALGAVHGRDDSGHGAAIQLQASDTVSPVPLQGSQLCLLWKNWSQNRWRSRAGAGGGHHNTRWSFQYRRQRGVLPLLRLHIDEGRARLTWAEGSFKPNNREVLGARDQVVVQAQDGLPHGVHVCAAQRTVPQVGQYQLEDSSWPRQSSCMESQEKENISHISQDDVSGLIKVHIKKSKQLSKSTSHHFTQKTQRVPAALIVKNLI